ncbi:hypothetical protein [Geodermatophilus marinus]|uniref:hypothetical protein n=1 Tax=Geodermatophilus sp. LHW52908 TaxID=2303986 RepID=UPI000E3DE9B5|nr:hypothetical protein [Geodermatophilus sp. LHW52908]RFU22944.1 hypothetical protein D0Z06_03585 [Geodermatophilus sp. LHW52908]
MVPLAVLLLVVAAALAAGAGVLMARSRVPRDDAADESTDSRGTAGLVLAVLAVLAAAAGAAGLDRTGSAAPFVLGAFVVLVPLAGAAVWGRLRDPGRVGAGPPRR